MIIDRIEGNYAVAEYSEDGAVSHININLCMFPEGVSEGDVIYEKDGLCYVDKTATEQRRKEIAERLRRMTGEK